MYCASLLMQIFQSFGDLDDDMTRQLLAEVREAHNLVEQLASGGEFEDDVVVLAGFGEIEEFYDVGVVKLAHDLYLLEDVGSL